MIRAIVFAGVLASSAAAAAESPAQQLSFVRIHAVRYWSLGDLQVGVRVGKVLHACNDAIAPSSRATCELRELPVGEARFVAWSPSDPEHPVFEKRIDVPEDGLRVQFLERTAAMSAGFFGMGTLWGGLAIAEARTGRTIGGGPVPNPGLAKGLAAALSFGGGVLARSSVWRFALETAALPPAPDSPKGRLGKTLVVNAIVSGTRDVEVSVETPLGKSSCGPPLEYQRPCTLYGLQPGPATVRLKTAGQLIEKQLELSVDMQELRIHYDPAPIRNGLIVMGLGVGTSALGWYVYEHPDQGNVFSRPGAIFVMALGAFFVGGGGYNIVRGLISPPVPTIELRPADAEEQRPRAVRAPFVTFQGASVEPSFDGSGATLAAAWTF